MQDSHTPVAAAQTADGDRLRLVPTATLGLAERLAGRLDGHLARFVEHMREGLLAASTAVGLEVMAELMDTVIHTGVVVSTHGRPNVALWLAAA